MQSTFPKALELVLKHEGGFVNHPRDPGGATNLGITLVTLAQWRQLPKEKVSADDVAKLTQAEAADIYRAKYWANIRGDELPLGLDYCLFDFAVNSGISRAAKFVQKRVGAEADGILGPMTLRAIAQANSETLINQICDDRLAWLKTLSTWSTFGKGWGNRVEGVRKEAVAIARS